MKFLLDMGLARSTAIYLRERGYDALYLREEGLQRLPDEKIVKKTLAERRIIITHDLDFGRLIALGQEVNPSDITFQLDNMQPVRVNHFLAQVLAQFSDELRHGALVSVKEQAIRVRILPVIK